MMCVGSAAGIPALLYEAESQGSAACVRACLGGRCYLIMLEDV